MAVANFLAKLEFCDLMSKKILKSLAPLVFVCTAGTAVAQTPPVIGSDTLLRWLASRDERDGALATGYIGGVREASYQKEHCASGEIKVVDAVGAVRRTLDGMPQYRNMPGSWTVIAALNARWPCPSKAVATAPKTPTTASPRSGDSSNKANWRALRMGMTEVEVKALVGEPLKVKGGDFTYWYWDRNAQVRFYKEKVDAWDEPG